MDTRPDFDLTRNMWLKVDMMTQMNKNEVAFKGV